MATGGVGYAIHGEAANSFYPPTPPTKTFLNSLYYEMDLLFAHCNLKLTNEQVKIGLILQ